MKKLTIPDMLNELRQPRLERALIDVRSELEFAKAMIPGSQNLPLLYQEERHQIGVAYKNAGQAAAIALGEELVGPHQKKRIEAWIKAIERSPRREATLMCWRGGLRSQISCEWLLAEGQPVLQLEGGYKALRQALRDRLESPPPLVVIQGYTGAGKTELIQQLSPHALDLEAAARHRGSAFGLSPGSSQPTQTSFENDVAVQLLRSTKPGRPVIVEDESRLIGRLCIPETLVAAMRLAPVIQLQASRAERAARIYSEYFAPPEQDAVSAADAQFAQRLQEMTLASFHQVAKRLDRHATPIRKQLLAAFERPSPEAHQVWISELLEHYYDKRYEFAAARLDRPVFFAGDLESCRAWIEERWPAEGRHARGA